MDGAGSVPNHVFGRRGLKRTKSLFREAVSCANLMCRTRLRSSRLHLNAMPESRIQRHQISTLSAQTNRRLPTAL